MPTELLSLTPAYVVVGAYRLGTDASLRQPIWLRVRKALLRGVIVAALFSTVSWPVTRLYARRVVRLGVSKEWAEEASWFGFNIVTYSTMMLVGGQASSILEFMLGRELRAARTSAYDATVKSRGKDASFWTPYVEEWKVPPYERAKRAAAKQTLYAKLATPIFRMLILRVLLLPLNFIPLLGIIVSAALRSLTMGRALHEPLFKAKGLTVEQRELFIAERAFGFTAAVLERLPILGLLFSVSNRIGAAMWAHDLEKRQHAFRSGELKPTAVYVPRDAKRPPSDLPSDAIGSFPTRKPALPPRSGQL